MDWVLESEKELAARVMEECERGGSVFGDSFSPETIAVIEEYERKLSECQEARDYYRKRVREEESRRQALERQLEECQARCDRLKEELCANCEYRKPPGESADLLARLASMEEMLSQCRDDMRLAIEASLGERLKWLDALKPHLEKIVRWSERTRQWIESDAKVIIARELEERLNKDERVITIKRVLDAREVVARDEFQRMLIDVIQDVLDKFMIPKTVFEP